MSLGVFFRLSDEEVSPLLNFQGSGEEILELIDDFEEQHFDTACEVDKAWDPIHCTLNPFEESQPIGHKGVVSGSEALVDDNQIGWVTHLNPQQVNAVRIFLDTLTDEQFTHSYNKMPLDLRNPEYGPQECAYALGWLEKVREFYRSADDESKHVIFSVAF